MRVTDKFVFFFSKDDVFSNWYIAPFVDPRIPDLTYRCVEQYMMAQKAALFNDVLTGKAILDGSRKRDNEKEQAYYKRMGREVLNYDEDVWVENRERIVKRGLLLKYTSSSELYSTLMQHKNKRFVEASPYDNIYGIKMGMWESGVEDEDNWRGDNLLGIWHDDLVQYLDKNERAMIF